MRPTVKSSQGNFAYKFFTVTCSCNLWSPARVAARLCTQVVARAWEQITYISKSGNARPGSSSANLLALNYHRAWAYCEVWYNLTSALFSNAHAATARGLRIPLHFIAAIASHLTNSGYSSVILIWWVAKYTTLFVANGSQMKPCAHRWYYCPYLCK